MKDVQPAGTKFPVPDPGTVSYLTMNFVDASAKIYVCFEQKNSFCNAKFWNLGASRGWVKNFDQNP